MKLRIKGNSLRLRLTKTEVSSLVSGNTIRESTIVSPFFSFSYSIKTWNMLVTGVHWDENQLVISVPETTTSIWASSDEEGMKDTLDNGTAEPLSVLVEKDFTCLKGSKGESDSDNFPRALH
ncbi:MAG: hypothetical protein IT223_09030 [Crocinitomicaceae bacterium]|nr:hypothetical protein [Crocinitomicaceae bacterium]